MTAEGAWRWIVGLLLTLATAAKFAAFTHALSFGHDDAWKVQAGALTGLAQALLWWWMARGLGRAGVIAGWLAQTLYLGVCWSYFAYFGLHLSIATALAVGGEGMTAVGHGVVPLTSGMLWLLADLPFVLLWCVADGGRWRWTWLAWAGQAALFGWLCVRADHALAWAAAERDDRYTAATVFITEFGLLPIQLVQARARDRTRDFRYGPETVVAPRDGMPRRRDLLLVQVESLDVGAIETAMPRLAARAADGVWYGRCLSYHGPGGSADCDTAVIEGCEPLWDAPSFDQPGYPWPNSWIRRLREAGWSAALAHGLPGTYFNFAQVMPRLGYDLWDIHALGLIQHPGEFGARDDELVDAVLKRLPDLPRPCVLHVVTMTSHAPFTQHRAWWPGPATGDDYRDCLTAVDAQLERLVAGFLARSPDGVVALFGDHAAGRPDSAIERTDGLQREFVPLVLLNTGEPARRDPRLASFLDLGRTLLPLVGWSGTVRTWGADLLPAGGQLGATRFHGRELTR